MKMRPGTQTGFLLCGKEWIDGDSFEVRSPWDQGLVGRVTIATRADARQAVSHAVASLRRARALPRWKRREILEDVAASLIEQKERFAQLIVAEAGKPIRLARAEVDRAVVTFKTAAEEAARLGGESLPLDLTEGNEGRWGLVQRFPVGPILAITPFNFPLNLVAHKIAPAMAAGCSIVLKPASKTPLVALMLADVIGRSGYPKEAVSILPMSTGTAAPLIEDERFKLFTFTGSAAAGWALKARAGKKRVALELGGNAGCIVHSDADVDNAVARCVAGGFAFAGQSCISVQRILVERTVFDEFLGKLAAAVQKLRVGDPADEGTEVGPMIRLSDAERAEKWIGEAVAGGAKLVCGGKRNGNVLSPTVLTGTTETQRVNCQEVFAPVVTMEAYDDFGEALARVNRSPYGLQAGVFTRDIGRLMRAYEELEVGAVIAGDVPTFRIDHMPYGGVKDSGSGREGIRYAIEEMTEPKLLVISQ